MLYNPLANCNEKFSDGSDKKVSGKEKKAQLK